MSRQNIKKVNKINKANKAKPTAIKKDKLLGPMRAFLIVALAIIVFYPPYLQGLFFEKHVLPTGIFVFTVFIVFLVYKWQRKDFTFLKTPTEYIAFAFITTYFISIFVAVHTRSAIIEWLKYCMYFAVFYMITELTDTLKTKLLFLWTIIASAVGVSIIGLDSANGGKFVGVLNKAFNIFGYKGDMFFGLFVSNRINSTLQYPNALASYVMALFFLTIGMLMIQKKWWQKAVAGTCSFILFVTFILTQSRGAQLLFPVVLVIFFLVMPKGNRIKAVTNVILFAVPATAIALIITPYLSADVLNIKVLGLLIAGIVLSGLVGITSKYVASAMQKINWKVYVGLISVSVAIIITAGIYVINSSVLVELKHDITVENRLQSIVKDVALEPNKEYILRYEAEAWMEEKKSYAYFVRVFSKNEKNILFGGSTQIIRENLQVTNGIEERSVKFTTPEDSELISIYFSNYYAGTGVKIYNVRVIDANTSKTYNIVLKNKYNLDKFTNRFKNILQQNSLVSREIFYKDGLEIFKDRWLLGAGGGAWNYLYRQYQSYNYASSQAHNFPLQLSIETGILGLLILLSLIIGLAYTYIRYYKKESMQIDKERIINNSEIRLTSGILSATIITTIAALLMHSIIDFDFSEASMLLLFWQLIAIYNREMKGILVLQEMLPFGARTKAISQKSNNKSESKVNIIAGIIIVVITFGFTSSFYIASMYAQRAYENLRNNDIQKAISSINKAISFDQFNEKYLLGYNPVPSRSDIKTGLSDLLFIKNSLLKEKAEKGEKIPENEQLEIQQQFATINRQINALEKEAENNLNLSSNIASFYFKTGQTEKGLNYLDNAIKQFPFEPSLWHSKVDVYFQLMGTHFNKGEHDTAKEYIDLGLNIINEATEANKRNMNPFVLKEGTVALLQRMQFMHDHWDQDTLSDINKIVHYSIFDMDVNMDGIPDQWRISDTTLFNASIVDNGMEVKATDRSFIYMQHYIKFEKGKSYKIEVKLKNPVEYITYHISGITPEALHLVQANGKYLAELFVENEPNGDENQFRLYLESDCVIKNIIVKEKPIS